MQFLCQMPNFSFLLYHFFSLIVQIIKKLLLVQYFFSGLPYLVQKASALKQNVGVKIFVCLVRFCIRIIRGYLFGLPPEFTLTSYSCIFYLFLTFYPGSNYIFIVRIDVGEVPCAPLRSAWRRKVQPKKQKMSPLKFRVYSRYFWQYSVCEIDCTLYSVCRSSQVILTKG